MDKAQFEALLPLIVAALMQKITEQKKISHDKAFLQLYSSRLYNALDNEKTKVWYYSAEKLFQLFEEEMSAGKLELPEY
ncbi:MAG: hypothetical protein LBI04_02640 [Treponema sp.]|jgi:5'-3' exonuclease|nr:hypothetical protein [Treponema sp.]